MKTLEEIKALLSQSKPIILEKYNWVIEIGIFGSYVRGEQNEDSDVDILIDYSKAPSLFRLLELENYLTEKLGIQTDVITKNGLKPWVKERILSEVIYV